MQKKTIQKNIQAKLSDWLSTITDQDLALSVKENLLVSGGSIASMLLNEPINDYDVYLMDIDICKRLAVYYTLNFQEIMVFDGREKDKLIKGFSEGRITYDDVLPIDQNNSHAISLRTLKEDQIKLYVKGGKGGLAVNSNIDKESSLYLPLFFSPNAISLSDNLQIVLRFWGNAEQIHKTFDFIHATNYFTYTDGIVLNLEAVESILTKQLKYQGSQYPLTSIIRAKKFIKRGYNISAGELLKIMYQISSLNLNDPDILEEQLIGVDVAYFGLIISALRGIRENDKDFILTSEYFNVLIDKIFNSADNSETQN